MRAKNYWFGGVAALLLLAIQPSYAASAPARDPAPPQNLITMNFQDVDISVLARFISDITGKNFVLDEGVRGKVSVISPTKVTPDKAYSIFQSVLQVISSLTHIAHGFLERPVSLQEVHPILPAQKSIDSWSGHYPCEVE